MRRLGIYIELHSRPTIQGVLFHNVFGDKAYDMPPLRWCRTAGSTGAWDPTQPRSRRRPFLHAGMVVTGKMIGGKDCQAGHARRGTDCAYAFQCVFPVSGGNWLARGRKIRRPAGARPRLSDSARGRDQRSQTAADDGRRQVLTRQTLEHSYDFINERFRLRMDVIMRNSAKPLPRASLPAEKSAIR